MKRATTILFVLLIASLLSPAALADGKRPMTIDDLFRFKRVSDPQISPDGSKVAYVITSVDLEKNSTNADLWLAATDGSWRKPLTTHPKHDRHPRWSPDGKRILFESTRSGDSQLWLIDVDGGEARQLTHIASEANTGIWSPDGKWIAFVSAVYPEYSTKPYAESNELNKKRKEEAEKNPVKAKVFTKLFYRHWDSYVEDKRQHLFVIEAPGERGASAHREPRDVTPGDRDAYPTSTTFSIGDDFTFSPDSKHLVFTATPKENEAWSTNFDICRVSIENTSTEWECLTKDNPAADGAPKFSPDGKMLAYRAQKRAGAEADKWQLFVVGCDSGGAVQGAARSLTANVDRSVDVITWHPNWGGKSRIYYAAEEKGNTRFFIANLDRNDNFTIVYNDWPHGGVSSSLTVSQDGRFSASLRAHLFSPAEVSAQGGTQAFRLPERGPAAFQEKSISQANADLLETLDLPKPESVTIEGAKGTSMQMWILNPPGFDPNKKWPLAYLVHGGPQSAWDDNWSFRWNAQLWAAQGYVVALPNPRGSTGFGQKYVDEISGDWGGKCFEDLMKGLEYLEKQPYIDTDRMAAAGASFGGYMMNWFQGNTTKFKTLINHCGVFNHESMYATTEELWFDEFEHGEGKPLWENREKYLKHSPHLKAKNFKTPMLIIHNDLDFRVPVSEGHQLFTTLQRLGVPSKFINFPDEGHWVLKPANSAYWHREVFAWLKKYCPPGGR